MSTFSGIGTALSSLLAQQRGLDTTGQNIANVNTPGYSRQQVELQSVGSPAVPALWSPYTGVGNGVDVANVQRVADTLLASRAQSQHGQLAYLNGRAVALSTVETGFGEPSDNGLASNLSTFWASWHDVANSPGDSSARAVVLQQAKTVTDTLHSMSGALQDQWSASRSQVDTVVSSVNSTATALAQINATIIHDTQTGLPTNELQDQRDQLVMNLADAVGATSRPTADGGLDVFVGGTAIVSGSVARSLQVSGGGSLGTAATDPVTLSWNGATYPASVTGTLGAAVETTNTTVPGYLAKIDAVAAQVASAVNTTHAAGYDASGAPGGAFFTGSTAATIQVAITDPSKIAASGVAPTVDPVTGLPVPNLDGSVADAMAQHASDATGPDALYRSLVTSLGADSAAATQRASIAGTTSSSTDAARSSESGVNLDEEMVNLMTYQHAYEGASRVLTSIDSMLDTLINRTGLVGR
jgi:flagellar hook-associated protein 1 FlgK